MNTSEVYDKIREEMKDIRKLSAPEPPPIKNTHPAVWDLVLADIKERDEFGLQKYGVRLQPFNGRDPLVDLYQELLDALVYTRSAIYERDNK